jgi:hypothetical protein
MLRPKLLAALAIVLALFYLCCPPGRWLMTPPMKVMPSGRFSVRSTTSARTIPSSTPANRRVAHALLLWQYQHQGQLYYL